MENTRKYKSYLRQGLKMKFTAIPEIQYRCKQCGKVFVHKVNLTRHHLYVHAAKKPYSCIKCKKKFHRSDNKLQHERHCHKIEYHSNGLKRKNTTEIVQPIKKKVKYDDYTGCGFKDSTKISYNIRVTKTAFKNAAITYTIKYGDNENLFPQEIDASIDAMAGRISSFRKENKALKFNMTLYVIFKRQLIHL